MECIPAMNKNGRIRIVLSMFLNLVNDVEDSQESFVRPTLLSGARWLVIWPHSLLKMLNDLCSPTASSMFNL